MIGLRRREDPNVLGGLYGLTVLTPILAGKELTLRRYLEAMGKGPHSPLAELAETHVARWVIIPELTYQGPPQLPDRLRSQQLLFSSTFDGPRDLYLERLCTVIAEHVDAIWGNCAGYPGPVRDNPEGVKRYMVHNQVTTGLFFAAYSHVTVEQVRDCLRRRGLLRRFLTKSFDDASALQAEFREHFPPDWRPVKPCPDPRSAPP